MFITISFSSCPIVLAIGEAMTWPRKRAERERDFKDRIFKGGHQSVNVGERGENERNE
jgi:hypothetical protein